MEWLRKIIIKKYILLILNPNPNLGVTSQLDPKKKMKVRFLMGLTCLPTAAPFPTTHFTPPYLPSFWPAHSSFLFTFLFSLIHSSLLLHPLSPTLPHHHHFHHHFSARSPENSCEPINTFTSFFWGKNF